MKKLFFEISLACLLTFLFFLPNLLQGKVPIPADSLLGLYHPFRDVSLDGYNPGKFPAKNPLITDPVLQTYPWRYQVVKNIKEGNLPLWNPYSFSGQPLAANIQSSPLQILNILFIIFDFKIAWALSVILPQLAITIFMYLFLRSLNLSKISSVFGSIVLPLTGFFIAWQAWGTVITTAMWLPLILLATTKLFTKISTKWFLILILATSQTILSGHWQTALYVFIAFISYCIYFFLKTGKRLPLFFSIVALILGISISAIQLFPSVEFLKYSARNIDQGYYQGREDWFLPPQNLIQLIAPDFFGNPATYNYWGIWNYAEFVSFIGIVPLSLAIYGLIVRSTYRGFFIALGLIALIFGLENPISKIPYSLSIPHVSSLQPSRIIFLLVFSLTGLTSIGLDRLLKEKSTLKIFFGPLIVILMLLAIASMTIFAKDLFPKDPNLDPVAIAKRNLILPVLTTFALLAITFLRLRIRSLAIILIFAITIFELFRFGYKFTSFSKFSWIFPKTQTTDFLASSQRPFRIMTTDRRIMHPNTSSVYGIESIDGYDPLYLQEYAKLISSWQSGAFQNEPASFNRIITPQKVDSPFVNLLNVKYILSFDEIKNPNLVKVFQEGETKVFENKKVIPRAFFVKEVVKVQNDNQEVTRLLDENFDLATKATSQEFDFRQEGTSSRVRFEKYTDQSQALSAQTDKDAPLILTNVFYPGWQATVDGRTVPIKKANFMFQSIIVPAGTHKVEFNFLPQSFYNGAYTSLAGLGGSFLVGVYLWKRKYQ